jgi:hypothetical protein
MKDLVFKNKNNQLLNLLHNTDKFILKRAEELHGVDLSYAENESPYIDGSRIDNVRAMPRGILLTFALVGNVNESREYFKSFVKSKQQGSLIETKDDGTEIIINGIAKISPYTHMEQSTTIQLELYCGQPYWEDVEFLIETISEVVDLLYFPVGGIPFGKIDVSSSEVVGRPFGEISVIKEDTIHNNGDTAVGMTIEIVALSTIKNPKIACSTGEQNGWYMKVNITMQPNDIIEINTTKGSKSITYNGNNTVNGVPVLSLLEFQGKDWLQLETGDNTFNVLSDDDVFDAYFNIFAKRRFE